jgi:cell wall assembly regulator SMI1
MTIEVPSPDPGAATDAWRTYLDYLAVHVPQAYQRLNGPADEGSITELETLVGQRLPESVKAGWRLHDGQRCDGDLGVALGMWWLPVADVASVWRVWAEIREEQDSAFFDELDKEQRSYPPDAIQLRYTSPGWIPLFQGPFDGDYIGVDFDPGPAGRPGQAINFGRDQEQKFVIGPDFATLLQWLVGEVSDGNVDISTRDGETHLAHRDGILLNALAEASHAEFD